jgi:hypothetical protein
LASPPVDATFFLEKPPPSRSKRHSKAKKKQDREKRKAVTDLDHSPPRDTKRRHIDPSEPMQTSFDLADQQVSHGAYVGWRDEPLKTKTPSLSEMVGEASKYSFNLVKWDARYDTCLFQTNSESFSPVPRFR